MAPPLTKVVTLYPKRGEELGSPLEFGSGTGTGSGGGILISPPTPNRVLCTDGTTAEITVSEFLCSDLETYGILIKDCPCDISVYIGAAIRHGVVCQNALADNYANSRVIGIAVFKSAPTLCDIVISGKSGNIYSGLDVTKDYFLSPTVPGGLTTIVPTGSGQVVQMISKPISLTQMAVNITLPLQRA